MPESGCLGIGWAELGYLMRLFFILLIIMCSSCTGTTTSFKKISKDGFFFEGKEVETLKPNVEFIIMKNEEEFNAIRKQFFGHHWNTVEAFTRWRPKTETCIIYVKDPEWKYEPEYIGHEVAHCIWGNWHETKVKPVNNYLDRLKEN